MEADALVVETAARFAQERLAPHAAAREKAGRIEPEVIREMGELGFFGAITPEEWDGAALDPVTYARLMEEIAAGDGSVSTLVSVQNRRPAWCSTRSGPRRRKTAGSGRWLAASMSAPSR